MSNEETLVSLVIEGIILPSYIGIVIPMNQPVFHGKHGRVFFAAHMRKMGQLFGSMKLFCRCLPRAFLLK